MKKKNLIITIVVVILVGAGAFFGGMKYQESRRPNISRQFAGQMGQRTGNQNRASFRPVNGEIISSDDKSITVKVADSSSRIILINDKTEINKAEKVTIDQLKTGEKVAVFGTDNSDGSVTAQNIQLNPVNPVSPGRNNPSN